MASASEVPPTTSSLIAPQTFLAPGADASRRSSCSDLESGSPAASRFASSRVNDSTADCETRVEVETFTCAAALFSSFTSIGESPRLMT